MSDVTTQFAREQDLRQAQRDLERIFASLPQAVVVIDPDSHAIRMCSPAVESVLGCSPENLPGRTTQHLYRDVTEYYEFCLWSKTALDANHLFRRICKMLREDGQEFDALQTVVPLNGPGDPSLIIVFMEVSAQTRPEPDAASAESGADALNVQNLGAMIYRSVNSQDWTLEVVSDGARAVTGYAPGAFTQSGYPFLKEIIHEPDREHVLNHIRDAVAGAGIFDVRYQIKSATGELRWVDHQGAVVRSPDGNGEWVEGMIVDITRDMHLREALVLHRQQMQSLLYHMLQSLERVREGVAGRIQRSIAGHLLQSTAGLHGVAGKNRKKALAGELQSVQKTLETAIEDCNAMAGEMVPPVLERLGLNAALEYLLRDFRLRHQLYVSLKWFGSLDRLDRDLEKFLYRSTEELIHNVFAHAGVTEARVSVRVQSDLIRVAVKDFGKGFPSPDSPPKNIGQRGYGLFIIRECAAHLRGTCVVATRRGTGSRVTIEIPLPLASQSPTPHDENARVDLGNETIELHEL
jgi:signal transduction histidine kinase